MNISDQRKRDLRQPRIYAVSPFCTEREAILRSVRQKPLTKDSATASLPYMSLKRDLLETFLRDINADFEAQLNERMEEVRKELESSRRKAIEALYNTWPQMGGSRNDLDVLKSELDKDSGGLTFGSHNNGRQASQAQGGTTIPMRVIQNEIRQVLYEADTSDIITQSQIKDRILEKHPDAKLPSVRTAISHFLSALTKEGGLELVEKGRAGSPHKYRKRDVETRGLRELGMFDSQ